MPLSSWPILDLGRVLWLIMMNFGLSLLSIPAEKRPYQQAWWRLYRKPRARFLLPHGPADNRGR
jgi:hypothetical protein